MLLYVVVSGTGFLQKLDQKMINMAKMAPLAAVAPGCGTCLLGKKRSSARARGDDQSWRSDLLEISNIAATTCDGGS